MNKGKRGFLFANDGLIYGVMPKRATRFSAGYDLTSIQSTIIMPGEMKLIKTGLTAYMQDDEVLLLFPRSGSAYKNQVTLQNAVGVIDKDYEGNEIGVLLRNEGKEPFQVHQGDRIAQAIFTKYLTTDNDQKTGERISGFGHTGV